MKQPTPLLLLILLTMSNPLSAQTPTKSEVVPLRGKTLYYEKYGQGDPLIFLHGYSLSSKSWRPYVADFATRYEVYLIDLTGHGQSAPFKEVLSFPSVTKDLDALLDYLELDRIKAIGFSFGGDVLYQLALLTPTRIESMITIGAVGSWDVNEFPQYQAGFTFENRHNFPWLADAHESDAQTKALMEQFVNYTVHLTAEQLQRITPEVLIMMGDDDEGMDLAEVARVRKHLPKSDLWVLPNVSHGAHEGESKEEFVIKAHNFLSKVN